MGLISAGRAIAARLYGGQRFGQREPCPYLASISDVHLSVTIIRNGHDLGFTAASNIGARAYNANTLPVLNVDSVLAEGSLRCMMDMLESIHSILMMGGPLGNPGGSEQQRRRRVFPTPTRAFCLLHLGKWCPSVL